MKRSKTTHKAYCLFFLLLTLTVMVHAQTGTIFGEILDKNTQEPVAYATIVIQSGNKITTGGITNDQGIFSISKIPLGSYQMEIQFIGYETIVKPFSLTTSERKLNIGTVFIEEDVVALESVEVTAERSTIEQKIDRKVINVGKDLTTIGASASDIMRNIPSVSVDQDGALSFRGNENVRILVDGKPTNINASQLLQQIPSTSIKTIELITNPSAKYNPEGMSGIINITLKKNTGLGFNGNLATGITFGKKTRYNNALDLNHRAGKFNFYGSYGNRLGTQVTEGILTRTLENTVQLTDNNNERSSHLIKVGMDYFINDKNTVSLYTNQNIFNSTSEGEKAILFNEDPSLNFSQFDNINDDNTNATYNFDLIHDFRKEGHRMEFEFDYNTLDRDIRNDFIFSGNIPLGDYEETIADKRTNTTINLDYVHPVNERSLLELGLESRLRRSDNQYDVSRPDLQNSVFSYDRNIYSFYTTFSQDFDTWQYHIGARIEDYSVDTQFDQADGSSDTFKNDFFSIYPSGFLKYIPDEAQKNSYQLSFSRRIDRPSLNQINPVRQISTPQIIILGNPRLNPQFTNSIEFNYNRRLDKGNFSIGGFYRKIEDEINRIGYFDEINPTLLFVDYANFDSNDAYGFEFSSNYRPTSWWSFNSSFDVYSRTQKGTIEEENVKVNNTLMNIRLNNSFSTTKNLTFQFFVFYSGKQKILQYELKDNFYANAGARYNFGKGKGTFSINFNDILRTQRFAFKTNRTVFQEGEFKRDTQNVYFGLSYRFGGGKNNALQRKKRDKNEKADKFL